MCSWNKLQYNHQCCRLYTLHCLCCWNKEKCDLHNNNEHRMYGLRSGVYLQHYHKCCDLYTLCCCLRHRDYLSVHSMYRNDEPSMFRVFVMSRWHKEKRHLYCSRKHGMHCLHSGIHV